jgi:hypothetical protein
MLAEPALPPWAEQQQSKAIIFVTGLPKKPMQVQTPSLSIVFLQQLFASVNVKICHKNTVNSG